MLNDAVNTEVNENQKYEALHNQYEDLLPQEKLEWLGSKTFEIATATNNKTTGIHEALENGRRLLQAAQENFRLGVIGEFRVGKSTLINSLIGQEVAFTDVLEATAVECQFHYDEANCATIHFKDGSAEQFTFDEVNELLDYNRDDVTWLNKINYVAYGVKSQRLADFDIWDAPGIGGSDDNERLANTFLDKLGGAVWVIDITLIGKASINRPLNQLKKTGKSVIGVLNRVDEYEGSVEEAINFVEKAYPDVFTEIVTISAIDALDAVLENEVSQPLEHLWSTVLEIFGKDQEQSVDKRLEKTMVAVNSQFGLKISALSRSIQDQIGYCDHLKFNLKYEKRRHLDSLPQEINYQADRVFSELESDIWRHLDSLNPATPEWQKNLEAIIARLKSAKLYDNAFSEISERVSKKVASDWYASTKEAINLSNTALAISSSGFGNNSKVNGDTESAENGFDVDTLSEKALEEGYYAGGVSAVVTAAFAAVSASISWPIILAALPIGAIAAWKKQKQLNSSSEGLQIQISEILNRAKQELLARITGDFTKHLDDTFDHAIEQIVLQRASKDLGIDSLLILEENLLSVKFLESLIGFSSSNPEEGLTFSSILSSLSHSGERLDIIITEPDTSLSAILTKISSETNVRLLLVTDEKTNDFDDVVQNCFGNWQGRKKTRAIVSKNFPIPSTLKGMLITTEFAFQSPISINSLPSSDVTLIPYKEGRLAAQRMFAMLWDGKTQSSEPVEVVTLY